MTNITSKLSGLAYSWLTRLAVPSFLSLMPSTVTANCPSDWLSANTSSLILDVANEGDCHGQLLIRWQTKTWVASENASKVGRLIAVPFDQKCSLRSKEGQVVEFACRRGGQTPLSGATFKRMRVADYVCDIDGKTRRIPAYQYKCIRGCNGDVPKTLDQQVDDCD